MHTVVAALAAIAVSVPARAAEFPQLDRAVTQIDASVEAWRSADRQVSAMRAQQEELAHRIAALKRLHSQDSFGPDATLEQLLQQSVIAGDQLGAQVSLRDGRRASAEQQITETVRTIDTQIRDLCPGLKSGDVASCAPVAKKLKALLALRDTVRAKASLLGEEGGTPREWTRYDVAIDPLDGPTDLREKADFIEDARDKLLKKIEAAQQRLVEAKQERDVSRAAQHFSTDIAMFDERSRSSRVARSSNGRASAETSLADRAPNNSGSAGSDTAAPAPKLGDEAPAVSADPNPGFDNNRTGGAGSTETVIAPPPATAVGGSVGIPVAGALPKQLDPNALINLDLKSVPNADIQSLEGLVANLKQLEGYLSTRATTIRKRAERLEQDEAKTKQR